MRRPPRITLPARQRGAALLILLALFATAAIYMLVSSLNKGSVTLSLARAEKNRAVLLEAKAALIAYAASETLQGASFQPGRLPCPDRTNNGDAESSCTTSANRIGRLPHNTLGIAELRDASGERLWYAVSNNFRTSASVINSNTLGTLTISGLAPATNAVAIVFSPGMRLGTQDRGTAGTNTVANYLEGKNSDATADDFESIVENLTDSVVANLFNDQLLAIASQDLFSVVEPVVAARIERDIKPGILAYFSKWTPNAFPYPAIFANPDPGISATRPQGQYIGNTGTANTGGLLPITASAAYTWSAGAVTMTGGTYGSISGISCASTSSPFNGLRCSFTINSYNPPWWNSWTCSGWSHCMINPSFSVRGDVANAGLSFGIPPVVGDVTVKSSVFGSTRTMSGTTLTPALFAAGTGRLTFQGEHSYSNHSWSSFSRSMVVTIPDVSPSPLTSAADATAGWFIANEWYRLVYYIVSPGYLPGAGPSCTALPGTPSCMTVNNMPSYYASPSTDKRVLLILAGRSLNGSTRPSSAPANYLEGENATPSDYIFEHGAGTVTSTGAAINDKVIVVAP